MMKYTNGTKWALAIAAGLALGSLTMPTRAANVFWQGPDHNGGSGQWDVAGNWLGGYPSGSDEVFFDGDDTAGQSLTTITIDDDATATTNGFRIRKGKNVTIAMGAGSSLTGGWLRVGTDGTGHLGSSVTFQGPAPDVTAANVSMDRIFTQNYFNDTPNNLTFAGNLNVTLRAAGDSNYSSIYNNSTLTITDGASVTANAWLLAYAQTGPVRVSIDNANLTARRVVSNYAGSVVQMTADSTMTITDTYWGLRIQNGGRFEGEGTGLNSANSRIYTGGTLAVGVTDPVTQTRTSAATLTLKNVVKMQDDTTLELGIFGSSGDNDQLIVAAGGGNLSSEGTGATSLLKLVAYGYTPHLGDTYTLITHTGNGYISPNLVFDQFDLPTLSAGHWDTTAFNIAGGWQISVVPEPAALGLLLVGGLGSLGRRRKS